MNFKYLSIVAAIASIAFSSQTAQASSYSSVLSFNESPNPGNGFYKASYQGVQWNGALGPLTATNVMGSVGGPGPAVLYIGNFTESTASGLQCSGAIQLTRYNNGGGYRLSVVKTASSGSGCGFRLHNTEKFGMIESLPIANSSGNFTPANSTTRFLQNGNFAIWPKWKVVDPTGLNCRNTGPGGLVVGAFPVATVINVTGFHSNGTWLRTSYNGTPCYVRSNSTYLSPVQIPF
jgi:hypothetical protein